MSKSRSAEDIIAEINMSGDRTPVFLHQALRAKTGRAIRDLMPEDVMWDGREFSVEQFNELLENIDKPEIFIERLKGMGVESEAAIEVLPFLQRRIENEKPSSRTR